MATGNHSSVPEGFKEIPGYGGRYFINEQGDVWSVARSRLMRPQTDRTHPYPWVLLRENGRAQPRTVYYLMRLAWMPPAPGEVGLGRDKWCVNHKDGNKLNSCIENLEWVTNKENLRHAWQNDLHCYGENCYRARFASDEVRQIRLRLLLGEKVKDLAVEFRVGKEAIKKMQQYVSWKRQDWDLIEPMMQICQSKWLSVTLECTKSGNGFYEYYP